MTQAQIDHALKLAHEYATALASPMVTSRETGNAWEALDTFLRSLLQDGGAQ